MNSLSQTLSRARTAAGLNPAAFSRLLGWSEERVREIEGGALPSPLELDAYALAFGVTVDALMRGEAKGSPMARLLFRATADHKESALDALAESDAYRPLGEFLRAVSQLDELDTLLGRSDRQQLPQPTTFAIDPRPPYGADALAKWLRESLRLELDPIDSMHEVLARLSVPVFYVSPEELDPAIDGASTSDPRPAVLVNLVEGGECWWRTRMTLAHELCHLLVDHRDSADPPFTISPYASSTHAGPRPRRRFEMYEGFDLVERRAGAFAAHFLAPSPAVRACVAHRDPTSEEAIASVGREFGIGRIAACYRLKHVYNLADSTHRAMVGRGHVDWYDAEARGDRAPAEVGLRTGVLRERALAALAAGKIDRTRCYEYLELPFTEPLPAHTGLDENLRRPLRTVDDTIRGVAQKYLEVEVGNDLVATTVRAGEADGWHVDAIRLPDRTPAGTLVISYDHVPLRFTPSGPPGQ
jgi:transcriptional regulator with XRE-family HTH domain